MATPTAVLDSVVNIGGYLSTVSSVNVPIPATTNSYDTVALVFGTRQKSATISMPLGWTNAAALSHTNGIGRVEVWTRAGIFSATTISVSWSSAVNGKVAVLEVDGALDDCDIAEEATYSTTITCPPSTSVSTTTRAVHVVTTSDNPRRVVIASGLTTLGDPVDHDYIIGMGVAHQAISATGATAETNDFTFKDTEGAFPDLGEFGTGVTMLFSQPASGAEVITGTGELPTLASVVIETSVDPLAPAATNDLDITVLDQNNDGIQNATVSVSITPPGVATISSPAVTNASGVSTITVTAVSGGSAQITAVVGPVTSAPVTVIVTGGGGMPPPIARKRKRR